MSPRFGVSNHSNFLSEITRRNLVGKTKVQSPQRYVKRLGYKPLSYNGIDIQNLLRDDECILKVPVGKYTVTIAYQGVLDKLIDVLQRQPRPNVTLQSVIRALTQAIDDTDVLVDCTCADFKYRFAFWSTKYGYKYGKPQNQPTKVTNPHDDKGAMCKHITSLLANKRWMVRVASVLNEYIRANPEQVRKSLGLEEDEFIVNLSGIHTPKVKPIPEPEEQEDEMEQEPEDVDTEIDTDIGEGEEDNG